MIVAAGAFAFIAALSVAICAMARPKWLGAIFPCLFMAALYGAAYAVNFAGYAVDARLLNGQEATVLSEVESAQSIFLLVRFAADNEPRLVRLANTEQNRKDAKKAKDEAQNGLVVIRFGDRNQNGRPGEADQADGIRLLDLAESKDFGKAP